MRTFIIVLTLYFLTVDAVAEPPESPSVRPHPALEIDVPVTPDEAWKALDDRPRISFATTDRAFERHRVPELPEEVHTWTGSAWRGERVHAQILVWSKKALSQLRAAPASLADSGGRRIPADAMRIRFVRYVISELPPGARQTHCKEIDTGGAWLVPDLLDPAPHLDVPAESTRPLWVTLDVPRETPAGTYSGELRVHARGFSARLQMNLEVQPGIVPPPTDWQFRVDFWQNPWAVAHQHRVEPWSDAHLAILRRHLRALADMGQTYVSAYITHSPWRDDTYIPDATMVEWIRNPDGSFRFDYRIFDTYVELAISSGIDDAISCFTLLPWGGRVRYLEGATGELVWAEWSTGSPEYEKFWRAFLADLRGHLTKKGWFEKTYLEINERSLEETLHAIRIVRSDSPNWKLTYAGNHHGELLEPVDDLCSFIEKETPPAAIAARRRRNQTTTFYVCCVPGFPNNFPFSPPSENVWMGWHAIAMGMDGFLRWAWDSWPDDPARDARHFRFPAGDTFLVYPGPVWSIRAERLREGFVDAEKIRIVRSRLAADSREAARSAAAALDKALALFTWERVKANGGSTIPQDLLAARAALADAGRIGFGNGEAPGSRGK
jgi:hypothetical protein